MRTPKEASPPRSMPPSSAVHFDPMSLTKAGSTGLFVPDPVDDHGAPDVVMEIEDLLKWFGQGLGHLREREPLGFRRTPRDPLGLNSHRVSRPALKAPTSNRAETVSDSFNRLWIRHPYSFTGRMSRDKPVVINRDFDHAYVHRVSLRIHGGF